MKSLRWTAFAVLATVSCSQTPDPDLPPGALRFEGTVQYVDVEGGCWALEAADGTRYQPVELAEQFREDDLAVRATLVPRNDVMSICQVGRLVGITGIERSDGATE